MAEKFSKIYKAVKKWDWDAIDKYVKDGGDINASLVSEGSEAGYTAIHYAAMDEDDEIASRLIKDYGPNVNSVAANGARPIHIAVLRASLGIADDLIESGAEVNVEFNKKVFKKHNEDPCGSWSSGYGGTITPLAFAIESRNRRLSEYLIVNGANIEIRDKKNKTLLMRALENADSRLVYELTYSMKDKPELLNARDNKGLHAVHYVLSSRGCGFSMFFGGDAIEDTQARFVGDLIDAGADMNAMINGDSDTILINMAAYKCCFEVLSRLLDLDVPLGPEAKPLQCVTLPPDSAKFRRLFDNFNDRLMANIEESRSECIEAVVQNLVLRREFGFFVPDSEIKLLDKLYATDQKVKKIVEDFRKVFIDDHLEENDVLFDEECITLYDCAVKVFDPRSLKLLVKDDLFISEYKDLYPQLKAEDKFKFHKVMYRKIQKAFERRVLTEEVQTLDVKSAIPLPYELILIIIEYLDDENLKGFIRAFYEDDIDWDFGFNDFDFSF